ncbi:MAG: YbaK/EbsC family protein [Terriglobia bacterium]|jgi:Ala-tRNA(Pro) deacylase
MAIPQRIRDYLDSQNVSYETLHHAQAFTAQEVAHSLHVSGKRCVKVVVARGDNKPLLVVMPASHRLNFQELKSALKANRLEMLVESELVGLFPDCDLGAVPPFGNLYGIGVCVDRAVANTEKIVFCAGTHEDCIRMRYSDFAKLTMPFLGHFSEPGTAQAV